MKLESTPRETDQLEKEFLDILSELIDDPVWLDTALNQNNSYRASDQLANQSINDRSPTNTKHSADPQDIANRLVQGVNVEATETDLEETIIVSTDVSSDLSLQTYPYQKSI